MMNTDLLHCLVEIPKGSRNKYEWDEELGAIKFDRFLFSSVVYPTDYGFIPDTETSEGEPLDAMVCVSAPTFPGCVIPVKAIAMLRMTDDGERDDKLLCVPQDDPSWNAMSCLADLSGQLRAEIEHFWSVYKLPTGHAIEVQGWEDREVALEVLEESRRRHRERE
jgi:inorganic pyrophosphatase